MPLNFLELAVPKRRLWLSTVIRRCNIVVTAAHDDNSKHVCCCWDHYTKARKTTHNLAGVPHLSLSPTQSHLHVR